MNILVVEDDILIAEMIKEILLELDHTVLAIAYNFDDAFNLIETASIIDMAILDIQLGKEKSGLKLAQKIQNEKKIPFIFLTSYSDRSIIDEALKYQPRAYLMKPFSKMELFTTLSIIQQQSIHSKSNEILLKDGNKHFKLNIADVLWIKSDNIYLEIQLENEKLIIRNSFKRFLEEVSDPRLKRVHRSYVINMDKMESVQGNFIIIKNQQIPVTRDSKDEILSYFEDET